MEGPTHDLNALCQQLGLPSETEALQAFISQHSPLAEAIELADAPFWSASQASFLREQLNKDADWAEVVDQLTLLLRRPRSNAAFQRKPIASRRRPIYRLGTPFPPRGLL